MPSDEYASASGGALRLKGAKVEKHRSKKHRKRSRDKERDREDRDDRARRAGDELDRRGEEDGDRDRRERKHRKKSKDGDGSNNEEAGEEEDALGDIKNDPYARMTAAERRFAEAQDKKIRDLMHASPEEARASRPELFKSHKERLADLNTYLSRLSEHNDMPKIGPG
ncbi:hypothetical protein SCUCBS95973_005037 [Sporothrix curviconia]|uniref:DUF1754-domain-containing protein n=1 Tax=Sporothrix curviconia TaxID=1260050 RepID=A0ABP0BTP5_9PEZI